jgi:ribosomal 30S subunit maturation factor RimM
MNGECPMSEEKVRTDEYKVTGDELLGKVKEIVHEGNIRRIIIKNDEGKTLIEIPLTLGVLGAVFLPVLAAVGAIAALAANFTLVVEKIED